MIKDALSGSAREAKTEKDVRDTSGRIIAQWWKAEEGTPREKLLGNCKFDENAFKSVLIK